MSRATVEWKGDNEQEIERLLREHLARADRECDQCRIRGIDGLNITLNPGDRIMVEGDRLGVLREVNGAADPTITWDGRSLPAMVKFLATYKVRLDVIDVTLFIYGEGEPQPAVLQPGDRLIERRGMIVVSKAGKDHRV